MKNVTNTIIEYFPMIEGKLNDRENSTLLDETIEGLNQIESTFLNLAWYFENPENVEFNLGLLYRNLDNNWLELALELINRFFIENTYLIQKPTLAIIRKDDNNYFSQIKFAEYLSENGLNFDRKKINVYYNRGKLPEPDLKIDGIPYWDKSTVEFFCKQEINRLKYENIGVGKEELFKSWVEEFGYEKAVLLSCNYPIRKVLDMSQDEAISEVEALDINV